MLESLVVASGIHATFLPNYRSFWMGKAHFRVKVVTSSHVRPLLFPPRPTLYHFLALSPPLPSLPCISSPGFSREQLATCEMQQVPLVTEQQAFTVRHPDLAPFKTSDPSPLETSTPALKGTMTVTRPVRRSAGKFPST